MAMECTAPARARHWRLSACAAGALLLAAGTAQADRVCFDADQDSGSLGFTGVQEGSAFDGYFGEFSVRYCMDPDTPQDGELHVTVATHTARTGEAMRDDVLQGAEFFFTGRFPEAVWESSSIEATDGGYRAEGELTLRDVSQATPVEFTLERDGNGFTMSGGATLMRLDFNVGTGENANPNFIGHEVGVKFELALEPAAP